MTASRNAHFVKRGQNESSGKRTKIQNSEAGSKKLRLQVASLQKKHDEQSQLSEIAAVIKEVSNTGTVSNTTAEEKSISMARKVMKIVGREKKSDSS